MLSNFEYQPPIMQNQNCFTSLYQNHIQNINNNHPYPQINQQVQSQNYFRNQARQSRNDRFDNNRFQNNYDTRNIQATIGLSNFKIRKENVCQIPVNINESKRWTLMKIFLG